jgi:UDP-N-acetylmuramoyl-tripeptide--D-alanyl-D-alanine ligase
VIPLSVAEVAAITFAQIIGSGNVSAKVSGLAIDSRKVDQNDLFVALPGEHTDGHNYVLSALMSGAAAALTDRPISGALCLVVESPLDAIGRLAGHVVGFLSARGMRVVGITGSQGKTSTKDLLSQILERSGSTVSPFGNLNNEIGVPLTALRTNENTDYLVLEMGARGIGHIDYLCQIAPPDVGIVLNVGSAHIGEFGSRAAIAKAKGELIGALRADGTALLNADDPLVAEMRHRTSARAVYYSTRSRPAPPAVWASEIRDDALGRSSFILNADSGQSTAHAPVELQLVGRHQVTNAMAAAGAAIRLGAEVNDVAAALSSSVARSRWRMECRERRDGVLVINDAYNANPDSMRAAIRTLSDIGRGGHRRTWAVLGDMLELGHTAEAEHRAVGRFVAEQDIDHLLAVGEHASTMASGAASYPAFSRSRAKIASGRDRAFAIVSSEIEPNDVVLVKASRGIQLEAIAERLLLED